MIQQYAKCLHQPNPSNSIKKKITKELENNDERTNSLGDHPLESHAAAVQRSGCTGVVGPRGTHISAAERARSRPMGFERGWLREPSCMGVDRCMIYAGAASSKMVVVPLSLAPQPS